MIRARPRHPRSIDAFFVANTNCWIRKYETALRVFARRRNAIHPRSTL